MKRLEDMFRRHQIKVWALTAVLVALLVVNVAAQKAVMPSSWEYKSIGFRVASDDDMVKLQSVFAEMLNREAASGWEYAGRCAHVDAAEYWVDYVVFRRLKR